MSGPSNRSDPLLDAIQRVAESPPAGSEVFKRPRRFERTAPPEPVPAPEPPSPEPPPEELLAVDPSSEPPVPFVTVVGHCTSCHAAFRAGSVETLAASGWAADGTAGLCPECRDQGWALPRDLASAE